ARQRQHAGPAPRARRPRGCCGSRRGSAAPAGPRPGRTVARRAHAALFGHFRGAWGKHRRRFRDAPRRARRPDGRAAGADHPARRRVQPRQRRAEREPVGEPRPGRGACRDRAFGRGHGAGAGGAGARRAAHHPERRQRGGDARALFAHGLPHVLLQLAAGLRHGPRARETGGEARRLGHLGLRRRERGGRGLPPGLGRRRRRGGARAEAALPGNQLPAAAGADPRPEPGRRGLLLRRRRCRAVRARVRGGRAEGARAALRLGLPDGGHIASAGRGGGGHPDGAALRRRARQSEEHGVPPRLPGAREPGCGRLRGAGLRRGAAPGHRARRRARRHFGREGADPCHARGARGQPSWGVHPLAVAQSGAEHLSARGPVGREPRGRRRGGGAGRPGHRLPHVL
ncbi:MAG: Benzoate transport, extracellular ligand-binding receptor, partial [uncultured Acetobacteraceae bacterium]